MHARSALFDLYGDHLRRRGGTAPIASLVRLLGSLGIAAPAVRTAVSRMVRQGWLVPMTLEGGPGYALTPKAVARLDDAVARVFRTDPPEWDGRWDLVVTSRPASRSARERLRAGMTFLGYAPIGDDTWVAPRRSPEAAALLDSEGVDVHWFGSARAEDARALVRSAWDLEALATAYARWLDEASLLVGDDVAPPATDEDAFALRSQLVHEWRKFLFTDPALPPELLPEDWVGSVAADFFDRHAAALQPGASRWVEACLRR
ncbi:MAG TPA: PaaX family transcriptional regulator C-terminal domain-containing protein [Actinomycetes bacterium]|nr:PaaX family transcriptional regulator C-terminal domain-containing protein [Actinomycetes bacterium]